MSIFLLFTWLLIWSGSILNDGHIFHQDKTIWKLHCERIVCVEKTLPFVWWYPNDSSQVKLFDRSIDLIDIDRFHTHTDTRLARFASGFLVSFRFFFLLDKRERYACSCLNFADRLTDRSATISFRLFRFNWN